MTHLMQLNTRWPILAVALLVSGGAPVLAEEPQGMMERVEATAKHIGEKIESKTKAVVKKVEEKHVVDKVGEKLKKACLLYTSDAADERSSVDLGGRRIIKKQNT